MSRVHLSVAASLACGALVAMFCWGAAARLDAQGSPAAGKAAYDKACAKCHGPAGKGDGADAKKLGFHPRDFTLGAFKCRCTPTGSPPSDQDLLRTVTNGMPGTPMLAHEKLLTADERTAVVQYIKTLSPAFAKGNPASCPAPPAAPTENLVAEGKGLYEKMGCAQCHGAGGRGDGPAAASLKDDWGNPIKPYNFVVTKMFKCGGTDADLFRTLQTGLTGTPMPAYVDALAVGLEGQGDAQKRQAVDRRTWALVQYLKSLGK